VRWRFHTAALQKGKPNKTANPDNRKGLDHASRFQLEAGAFARLQRLCGIVVFLDYLWPFLDGYLPVSRVGFGVIGGLLALAAIPSRIVVQDSVSGGRDAE
jgi:hypothetical protein